MNSKHDFTRYSYWSKDTPCPGFFRKQQHRQGAVHTMKSNTPA